MMKKALRRRIARCDPRIANEETTFGDISGGKSLNGKIAGGDPVGQSTDWEAAGVKGWMPASY